MTRTCKPYSEWTDEEFRAYALKCYQLDWEEFKAKLLRDEAEFNARIEAFLDEQIAKNDPTTVLSDLAAFILGDQS